MNNQFWREIYDQVDTPVMIFRDDAGSVHLMFVNKAVQCYLGYTAEEYVLESEQAGALRDALERMLTKLPYDEEEQEVTIPSQAGEDVSFKATKRAFKSVAIKEALTVVTLLLREEMVMTARALRPEPEPDAKAIEGSAEAERFELERPKVDTSQSYEEHMREYLGQVLRECGGKIYGKGGAAERLKLKPTTLQSKLIKYGVER